MGEPLIGKRAKSAAAEAADNIGFGVGEPLSLVRKEKRSKSAAAEAADNIGFGMGEPLELVKEKRSKSAAAKAADKIGFGMGEPLEIVEKRSKSAAAEAADNIGFGMGEPLLAVRDDPLIRRKADELSALLKERAPGLSMSEILIRAESRLPDVAAPAA